MLLGYPARPFSYLVLWTFFFGLFLFFFSLCRRTA